MAIREFTADLDFMRKSMRRFVLNGPPNSRKTSSLRTLPGNIIIQFYPGEKGYASTPWTNFEGKKIRAFVSDDIDLGKPQNWPQIWQEQWDLTVSILTGKRGECDVFVGDGLHKFYQVALAAQCNGDNFEGWKNTEEKTIGRLYGAAHGPFSKYLDLVFKSPVGWAGFLLWDGSEKENDLDPSPKALRRKYPDLPGKMSKHIMGETSVVLHADSDGQGQHARYFWRTSPGGDVSGAGIKMPFDIRAKINLPKEYDQDFYKLDHLIMTQVEDVFNKLQQPKEVAHETV